MDVHGFLDRPDGERIAWRKVDGAGPTVVWLGGFMSEMSGTKAQALSAWAEAGPLSMMKTRAVPRYPARRALAMAAASEARARASRCGSGR